MQPAFQLICIVASIVVGAVAGLVVACVVGLPIAVASSALFFWAPSPETIALRHARILCGAAMFGFVLASLYGLRSSKLLVFGCLAGVASAAVVMAQFTSRGMPFLMPSGGYPVAMYTGILVAAAACWLYPDRLSFPLRRLSLRPHSKPGDAAELAVAPEPAQRSLSD